MTQIPVPPLERTPVPPPPDEGNVYLGDPANLIDETGRLTEEGLKYAGTLKYVLGVDVNPIDEEVYNTRLEKLLETNENTEDSNENNISDQANDPAFKKGDKIQITIGGVDQSAKGFEVLEIVQQDGEQFVKFKDELGNERYVPLENASKFESTPDSGSTSTDEEPTPETEEEAKASREEDFQEMVNLASQTIYVDSTNLVFDSKDAKFIEENPDFQIPTWERIAPHYDSKEPLNLVDRAWSKFWIVISQGHNSLSDPRHQESMINKKAQDYLMECQSTGDDTHIRALFAVETSPGVFEDLYTGASVKATDVQEARDTFGTHYNDFQAAWWYELINKAQNEGDFIKAMNRGLEIMNEAMARGPISPRGPAWTEGQVMGALKGVEFQGKSQHLSFKHANIIWNKDGQLQYIGIKGADLMRELTGKFQGYAVGGLSGVDASNLATLAETSLQTSVDYARLPKGHPDRPTKDELDVAQFVLQRFAKQVSDMRMGLMGSADGASDEEMARMELKRAELAALQKDPDFLQTSTDVVVDKTTGKISTSREKLRTGGAAITGAIWERIAMYSDYAVAVFPNIKYMDSSEMSPLDKVINDGVNGYKQQAGRELTEEEIFIYKKKIARQAVAISTHSWKTKDIPMRDSNGDIQYDENGDLVYEPNAAYVSQASEDDKKRRRLNKEAQKRKKQELRGR